MPAFVKGQSGNPSGRPKENAEVKALARQHTQAAIEALVASLGDPKARVAAATALLDRGWGKAAQDLTVRHEANPDTLTDAELAAIAAGGSREASAPEDDQVEPGGLVH